MYGAWPRAMEIAVGAGFADSNKRAKEIIRGGGFRVDGRKVIDPTFVISPGCHSVESGKSMVHVTID